MCTPSPKCPGRTENLGQCILIVISSPNKSHYLAITNEKRATVEYPCPIGMKPKYELVKEFVILKNLSMTFYTSRIRYAEYVYCTGLLSNDFIEYITI